MASDDHKARTSGERSHPLFVDMTGRMVGEHLRVLRRHHENDARGRALWVALCLPCGREKVFSGDHLRRGLVRSCGCLQRQSISAAKTVHGAARKGKATPEYQAWCNLIRRCTDPKATRYRDWGGRGITVCAEWRHDFPAFLAHVGPRPSPRHSIDRIDNTRGYEPGNVRWSDLSHQGRNKRSNRLVTHAGETRTVAEWSEVTGIPYHTLYCRLDRGWPPDRALSP